MLSHTKLNFRLRTPLTIPPLLTLFLTALSVSLYTEVCCGLASFDVVRIPWPHLTPSRNNLWRDCGVQGNPNGKLLKQTKDTEYKRRFSHVFRALFVREFEERNSLAVKLASSNISLFHSQISDNSSGEHLGPAMQAMAAEFIPGSAKLWENVSVGPTTWTEVVSALPGEAAARDVGGLTGLGWTRWAEDLIEAEVEIPRTDSTPHRRVSPG